MHVQAWVRQDADLLPSFRRAVAVETWREQRADTALIAPPGPVGFSTRRAGSIGF